MRTYLEVAESSMTMDEQFNSNCVRLQNMAMECFEILESNNKLHDPDDYWLVKNMFNIKSYFVRDLKHYETLKDEVIELYEECDKLALLLNPLSMDLLTYILGYIMCDDKYWTVFRYINDVTRTPQYRTAVSMMCQKRIPITVTHLCDATWKTKMIFWVAIDYNINIKMFTNLESLCFKCIAYLDDLNSLTHLKKIRCHKYVDQDILDLFSKYTIIITWDTN